MNNNNDTWIPLLEKLIFADIPQEFSLQQKFLEAISKCIYKELIENAALTSHIDFEASEEAVELCKDWISLKNPPEVKNELTIILNNYRPLQDENWEIAVIIISYITKHINDLDIQELIYNSMPDSLKNCFDEYCILSKTKSLISTCRPISDILINVFHNFSGYENNEFSQLTYSQMSHLLLRSDYLGEGILNSNLLGSLYFTTPKLSENLEVSVASFVILHNYNMYSGLAFNDKLVLFALVVALENCVYDPELLTAVVDVVGLQRITGLISSWDSLIGEEYAQELTNQVRSLYPEEMLSLDMNLKYLEEKINSSRSKNFLSYSAEF